ncbi:prepilin-type N-terminal cleavage/methylation domain-containing protein [Vibrio agarivorans]|uniref:prepilin-type N-terminal cleavage/methylation domain-containing protein n=1 Tax=Vibrio agarivorans TaxID=153622 RepID=UPI0025B4A02B|nr:prepilin-type N-terminal cleavage/methylation domain-containing protein [Vibrio agarivorans]MDN3660983.1 prepilin-type N-terminal cleavage/methylation domain-containing protein [Vibrio agarivorans]
MVQDDRNQLNVNHQGFTLIELVVLIVILAILAVVALPKFVNLSTDARQETMHTVGAAMRSALELVHSQAVVEGQDIEQGQIYIGNVLLPLYNGYPAVDGSDSFDELNEQLKAWMTIDSVSKTAIIANPEAAPFFTDKSSSQNQIYIFFSDAPTEGNRTEYGCQVRYQNPEGGEVSVRVLTDEC